MAENRLEGIHPRFARKMELLMKNVKQRGFDISIAQGLRSLAHQSRLYAQGRTTKGSVVTNAPAGFSPHNYGCAVDFQLTFPVKENQRGKMVMTHFPDKSLVWDVIGIEAKALGLEWGGEWKKFKDRPHVEVPILKYGRPLLKLVKDGSMKAVWAEVDKVLKGEVGTDPEQPLNPDHSEEWDYRVQAGDTLTGIAKKYLGDALRYVEIVNLSDLDNTNLLVGQVIRMPKR